ncbi:MAG TPA: 30S ribosomal protein S20 [Gemmatimonadetes bacterium]|jgi:small subunit ribosomal protein S20|nr:30S ribosomal protein S20 [Gemmatimonadota bacterium]
MPNIKSAKKRMQTSRNANERNRTVRSRLRNAIKRVRIAEDTASAELEYKKAQVLLDRAATDRILHPNASARIKSRLSKSIASQPS